MTKRIFALIAPVRAHHLAKSGSAPKSNLEIFYGRFQFIFISNKILLKTHFRTAINSFAKDSLMQGVLCHKNNAKSINK